MKHVLHIIIVAFSWCAPLVHGAEAEQWQKSEGCSSGLHQQPNGPYAVMLFCEDALGTYLSVVYLKPLGAPHVEEGRWSLENRYWFGAEWGSDVTGFKWSTDGRSLLVSTSPIYGSGAYYELKLPSKSAVQLLPKNGKATVNEPGPGYEISGEIFK